MPCAFIEQSRKITQKKTNPPKKQNYHQSQKNKYQRWQQQQQKLRKHITEIYIKRNQSTEPST